MSLRSLVQAFALSLTLALPAAAQTVQEAREAYNSGDYDTALAIAAPLADAGEPGAQNVMALLYEEGLAGLPVDIPRAMMLYEASAAAGWGPGQRNLGNVLREGIPGVPADPERALSLMTMAHEQGTPGATVDLAHMYWDGTGTEVDMVEARRLLELGTAAGDSDAMNDLGVMFEDGDGGPMDLDRAMSLYRQAAELGNALGGLNVATLLIADPDVTPEQRIEAVAWCLWADVRADDDDYNETAVAEDCAPILAEADGATMEAGRVMADGLLGTF